MPTKTKKIKTDEFLENSRKQCRYPLVVDGKSRIICVPQDELGLAEQDMMVSFLRNQHGFFIQSCIPGSVVINEKKDFNPEFKQRIVKHEEKEDDVYKKGDKFRIESTGTVLEIKEILTHEGTKKLPEIQYILRYVDAMKEDLKYRKGQLDHALRRTWVRI